MGESENKEDRENRKERKRERGGGECEGLLIKTSQRRKSDVEVMIGESSRQG